MTEPLRYSPSIVELGRDLMACMMPSTGQRGNGQVLVEPIGNDPVFLPRNWALVPIVNGDAREDLLFKVGEGPNKAKYPNGVRKKTDPNEPDTQSWWVIPPGGALVNIHSIIGGKRHNLKKGTKFVFDPNYPLLKASVILQDDITDAVDPIHFGAARGMVQFEQLEGSSPTLDAFRSQIGAMPGVVIVWDGSEPADGTTQSSLERGKTRAGQSKQFFKERFNLFVISERTDSGSQRRSEGLKLLDDITLLLTDKQSVDGQIFSSPAPVQVRGRNRIGGDSAQYQSVYVYVLQLSVTNIWRSYDFRTFNPWLRVYNEFLTNE